MEKIVISGGKPLCGRVKVSGAKNASLPLMAASILSDEPLVLHNIPKLSDITLMAELLTHHGVHISYDAATQAYTFAALSIIDTTAPYEIVSKMRASIVVLGPMLARCGEATVSLPGGCAIGTRPVNMHIDGLRALGATVSIENGYIHAKAPKEGLVGTTIILPFATVTGTENILMAAVLARGQTIIKNAAKEPEVCDLAKCLVKMGAHVEGIGTDTLVISGRTHLNGATHHVIPDRIEAATYAIAGAITYGDIILEGVVFDDLLAFWDSLLKAGVTVEKVESENAAISSVTAHAEHRRDEATNFLQFGVGIRVPAEIKGVDIMTEPYPGFPTDAQAQFMALMTRCDGAAMITETVFENRFMHVSELCRMCANITIHNTSALVRGVDQLVGATVMATDLRASVSLVLAGLAAKGETTIQRVYHIDRGYERIEQKLQTCGAMIERVR
ncbi:MAG: UDP-N-acetylglucosamine 1-carboxyvinyltransferase [Holosporales bacterium]|jgi:UDP-N-acetylglucosamine 1-carboxyvinyltransferase|nr:UDP-N-acetylglucosamine 1-carboxyvinyltransferase [Holosporales bacterium]